MFVAISHNDISDYYGRKLEKTGDLKTTACSASKSPHPILRDLMGKIPLEISAQFYGCGAPVPLGIEGRRVRLLNLLLRVGKKPTVCVDLLLLFSLVAMHQVLDLGCGSGRDCYLASALVGKDGAVTGIDMTSKLLDVRHIFSKHCIYFTSRSRPQLRAFTVLVCIGCGPCFC